MGTAPDYEAIIQQRASHVFGVMAARVSADDLRRIINAFELARVAHAKQKRKTGGPYILPKLGLPSPPRNCS